ncbi:hypothetical protein F0L68_20905 [Solihabitans fulvus]|uniref:Uncharacterized protein n=1 Tax=Solihabitans fulvus TaxID=1892852 RepID=A0A5B2X8C7_9PSEU|nr:hypothetical protein [Solihabitans fulvus]KAA2259406.1 hypothetical protein F0L68_20905 [Solihabitans fulvus]
MRRTLATLIALSALLVAGCSGSTTPGHVLPAAQATPLRAALARIAATDDTRTSVAYDHTSTLVRLAGKDWSIGAGGFASLRGAGAGAIAQYGSILQDKANIRLFDADFAISAGKPPKQLVLVAGGQNDQARQGLSQLGWQEDNGVLRAPGLDKLSEDLGALEFSLAQARVSGSDLVYGGMGSKLDDASPSGPTLADDPTIGGLADCLGDVVAAAIDTPVLHGKLHPTAIAVGVRAPGNNSDTPHILLCASWPDADAANQYTTLLRKALDSASSAVTNQPWRDRLSGVTVHDPTGDRHIVGWDADTPNGRATTVLQMMMNLDLPAFPCEGKAMPPAVRAKLSDYC